ncbi:MAG: hypothetical protein EOM26_06490 [Alphaproteobacteria bacterium]|nr:hypothetical protein [Alphaproteobacteria bacterium]
MLRLTRLPGILLLALACAGTAFAADPKPIGTYGEWSAYTFSEGGNKVCYMASQPRKAEGDYTRRGDIYALITHRPAEGTKNVFSYITGYEYKPASDVTIQIGSERFTLFTQGETAWAPDAETDDALAKAIRAGSTMVVTGTSKRGTPTTDSYSLSGSSAAHDAITKECGL